MAVTSIIDLSGHGMNSEVQSPDRTDFLGNVGNTPVMLTFSRLDLNTNQDRIDESGNEENFEDGDFPALELNYDRRAQAHHVMTGHSAPHNSFPRISLVEFKPKTTHCHSNSPNHKTWQIMFYLTTDCQ